MRSGDTFHKSKAWRKIVNPICSELFHASLRGFIMNEYLARSLKYLKVRSKKHQNLTLCACIHVFSKPAHSLWRLRQGSLPSEFWLLLEQEQRWQIHLPLAKWETPPVPTVACCPERGVAVQIQMEQVPHRGAQLWVLVACAQSSTGELVVYTCWRGPRARDMLTAPLSLVCFCVCHRALCD